jgi:hypothetical protein
MKEDSDWLWPGRPFLQDSTLPLWRGWLDGHACVPRFLGCAANQPPEQGGVMPPLAADVYADLQPCWLEGYIAFAVVRLKLSVE